MSDVDKASEVSPPVRVVAVSIPAGGFDEDSPPGDRARDRGVRNSAPAGRVSVPGDGSRGCRKAPRALTAGSSGAAAPLAARNGDRSSVGWRPTLA